MPRFEVKPHIFWKHKYSTRTASFFGSHPAPNARDEWYKHTEGFVVWDNQKNVFGFGKPAWKTKPEAENHANRLSELYNLPLPY